ERNSIWRAKILRAGVARDEGEVAHRDVGWRKALARRSGVVECCDFRCGEHPVVERYLVHQSSQGALKPTNDIIADLAPGQIDIGRRQAALKYAVGVERNVGAASHKY